MMSGCHPKPLSDLLVVRNKRYIMKSQVPQRVEEEKSLADLLADQLIRIKDIEKKIAFIEKKLSHLLTY